MIGELRNKLNQLQESRKNVDYALDMLEGGVGYKSYSNISMELDSLIEFNNRLADGIMALVETQELLNISLASVIDVELSTLNLGGLRNED